MTGKGPAPHQQAKPRLQVAWWQRPHRFETVLQDASEAKLAKDGDTSVTSSLDTQSLESGSNEESVLGQQSSATSDHALEELDSDLSHASQKRARTSKNLTVAVTDAVDVQHLLAENALLKRQLREALDFLVPSAEANAAAAEAVADELRMQNRNLMKMLSDLQEKNAALLQRQHEMQHMFQESAGLQRSLEENTMRLVEDISELEVQLAKQRQKCTDSEIQQDALKQLCQKLSMAMHGEDERLDKSLQNIAAEEKGFRLNKDSITVSQPSACNTTENAVAHEHAKHGPLLPTSAESCLQSATHRCDGKPTMASLAGSLAQGKAGRGAQTAVCSSLAQRGASERRPRVFSSSRQVSLPAIFQRQSVT